MFIKSDKTKKKYSFDWYLLIRQFLQYIESSTHICLRKVVNSTEPVDDLVFVL